MFIDDPLTRKPAMTLGSKRPDRAITSAHMGDPDRDYRRALERAGVTTDDLDLLRELADANRQLTVVPTAPPMTRTFL